MSLYTPSKEILGEGAFKKVYKVGDEAVAVMNITVLYNDVCAANEVTRELAILCHLTKLVARRICPNFVTIIGSFVQCYPSGSLHSLERLEGHRTLGFVCAWDSAAVVTSRAG